MVVLRRAEPVAAGRRAAAVERLRRHRAPPLAAALATMLAFVGCAPSHPAGPVRGQAAAGLLVALDPPRTAVGPPVAPTWLREAEAAVPEAAPTTPLLPGASESLELPWDAEPAPAPRPPTAQAAAQNGNAPEETPEELDFDTEAWLHAQGVGTWPYDDSCWRKVDQGAGAVERAVNECQCRGTIVAAGRPLLWCQSPHLLPSDGDSIAVTHMVLYEIRAGRMRTVLDVPTSAAAAECKADRADACWVVLRTTSEPDALLIADGPSGNCDRALALVDEHIRSGQSWRRPMRSALQRVCASRGRYRWRWGSLSIERPAAARM